MPPPHEGTRLFEANLWIRTAFQLSTHRFMTNDEKALEVERCLLRMAWR